MCARQWKKANVVLWWTVSVRGIALHDTGRRWDDTSTEAIVDVLQCGRLYMVMNSFVWDKYACIWKKKILMTLFHAWLDNHSDPQERNGSGAGLTVHCPWRGRRGDWNSKNLPSLKSLNYEVANNMQHWLTSTHGYFVCVTSVNVLHR